MMKNDLSFKFVLIFFSSLLSCFLIGCAEPSLQTNYQAKPGATLSGPRVALSLRGRSELLKSAGGLEVISESKKMLEAKGFQVFETRKQADTVVIFELKDPPLAYNKHSGEEGIVMTIYRQEHGAQPIFIGRGTSKLSMYVGDFLSKPLNVDEAVHALLQQSIFAATDVATLPTPAGDVGCWPDLGIDFGQGGTIAHIQPGSGADRAGLKVGDMMTKVDGTVYTAWHGKKHTPFKNGQSVSVTYSRHGKDHSAQIVTNVVCED